MRCMSCEADIPPQWVNAIQCNTCPGCGGEIMNQPAKELLEELTQAIDRMPNNPQGIAGWLLSNYNFSKIGDAKPVDRFHTKQSRRADLEPDVSGLKIADNPVQKLLKRTDSYKNIQATRAKLGNSRGDKLAQLAAGISSIEESENSLMSEEEFVEEGYDEEPMERGPRLSRQLATGATLVDATVKPLTYEELSALNETVQEEQEPEMANRVLQEQRLKRLRAQAGVSSGGGMGSFRRSE